MKLFAEIKDFFFFDFDVSGIVVSRGIKEGAGVLFVVVYDIVTGELVGDVVADHEGRQADDTVDWDGLLLHPVLGEFACGFGRHIIKLLFGMGWGEDEVMSSFLTILRRSEKRWIFNVFLF
ncbi:hypothetical protein AYI69_g5302 [Smittium culicis]|uniref:Uncharacterized protein n=1 Tax=Smittium culicis TaxID=133412 RepID=A0A1R1Y6Z2_9FUNG|nr:hypothetical protein AYI69_g5302 [Smittium culicis]